MNPSAGGTDAYKQVNGTETTFNCWKNRRAGETDDNKQMNITESILNCSENRRQYQINK